MSEDIAGDLSVPRGTSRRWDLTRAASAQGELGSARLYPAVVVAAAVAAVALMWWLGQGLTFFNDEFRIMTRQWTVDDLLRPHNEHWSTGFLVVWMAIRDVFGSDGYRPFHAMLIVSDLFMASGLYAVLRRVGGPGYAAGAVILFLFFGTGFENFFWAFQMDFALAAGFGLWALAVRDARLAAVLLTVAAGTQGVGLFFLAAAVIRWLGRREALWLALPIGVYGAWFLAYGLHAMGQEVSPASFPNLIQFAYMGIGNAVASPFTLPWWLGLGFLAGLLYVGFRSTSWRWTLAALVGLVSMFLTIGLVRSQLGTDAAVASRYMYVALPFVLILGAVAVERLRLPWRLLGPPLVGAAVLLNLEELFFARLVWQMYLDGRIQT